MKKKRKKRRPRKRIKKEEKKKTKKKNKFNILEIFIRYFILLFFGIFISIFHKIFLPLTIWPVYWLLNIFYTASIFPEMIIANGVGIEIIGSCVAGSAYFLLLILNLTTPMNLKKRIYSIFFSFVFLLSLNILRIFILSVVYLEASSYFNVMHKFFWYVLSIIFVVFIWFFTIKIFKIKQIPAYSDIKKFYSKK